MSRHPLPAEAPEGASPGPRPVDLPGVSALGRFGLRLNASLGALAIFFLHAAARMLHWKQIPEIVHQIYFIGAKSASIVALVGFFTGMVLGLQLVYVMNKFGAVGFLGTAVALSLIRELGPVLTAIMITARAGSAMAAEIGIQRISEQIDALETMDIDPMRYLISPRVAAALICFPLLTALFDVVGLYGGYLSGSVLLGVNPAFYFARAQSSVEMADIVGGFLKSIVFAAIVVAICCYQGYYTHTRAEFGAKGVSQSTTSAVVISCVLILVADYVLTTFLM